ncbi:hypothetical protein TNCV_3105481 [Trichonephila clavipes]|nr:hypothetical protein TNCV_3105481 [Trichonephila clavipes]
MEYIPWNAYKKSAFNRLGSSSADPPSQVSAPLMGRSDRAALEAGTTKRRIRNKRVFRTEKNTSAHGHGLTPG